MANNKDFKVKNSIKPVVYYEGVGTVTTEDVVYSLADAYPTGLSFSVATEEASPSDLAFKSDGTKMYIIGASGDDINQYSLSTAWDITTASFDSVTFSVATEELAPQALYIKSDGTKFWVAGNSNDTVYQYSMSTAWDMSTASYDSVSFSVSSNVTYPVGLWFKSDGTEMYLADTAGTDEVVQYSLSTAWDISTASYTTSLDISSLVTTVNSVIFNPTGTKMYVSDVTADVVYQYNLSTAWDISTAYYSNISMPLTSELDYPSGIYFKSDGTKMYVLNYGTGDTVYEYATPSTHAKTLDLSTGSVFETDLTKSTDIQISSSADSGVVDSATLIMHGNVASSYNIASASFRSMFYVGSQDTAPQGVTFKPDGTKMYLVGDAGNTVDEYSLSTPWEITSATFTQSKSVSTEDGSPRHVFFRADGLKMYMIGQASDRVHEYDLSTAWDISTASILQNFLVSSQDTIPKAVFFKPDGLKMYILGGNPDAVYQYSLSTAWDVSTASYDSVSFSVTSQSTAMECMYITSDGTKMYVINSTGTDEVFEYEFSTAWDVSSLSYTGVSFSDIPRVGSTNNTTFGVTISEDGTKMYIVEGSEDVIMQFDIGGTATVYYDNSISFAGDTPPVSPNDGETDIVTFFTKDGGTTYKALQVMNGAK